jgi:hypothetical protein
MRIMKIREMEILVKIDEILPAGMLYDRIRMTERRPGRPRSRGNFCVVATGQRGGLEAGSGPVLKARLEVMNAVHAARDHEAVRYVTRNQLLEVSTILE